MPDADDNHNNSVMQSPQSRSSAGSKQKRPLLLLFLLFAVIVAVVFLTQQKDTINWIEDYEAGIKQAKQQNKPALLAFYKANTRFCSLMDQNTYNNPDVVQYIEAGFVPILIDVDKHPKIAARFGVDYYPTHYVKPPDADELIGPHRGYDEPQAFIKILKGYREKLTLPPK